MKKVVTFGEIMLRLNRQEEAPIGQAERKVGKIC